MAENKMNEWVPGLSGAQVRILIKETFSYVESLIKSLTSLSFKEYESYEKLEEDLNKGILEENKIYLAPSSDNSNVYNQYIYSKDDNKLISVGSSEIDLTSINNSISTLIANVNDLWEVIGDVNEEDNQWITNSNILSVLNNLIEQTSSTAQLARNLNSQVLINTDKILILQGQLSTISNDVSHIADIVDNINTDIELLINYVNSLNKFDHLPLDKEKESMSILTNVPEDSLNVYEIEFIEGWDPSWGGTLLDIQGDLSVIQKDSKIKFESQEFTVLDSISRDSYTENISSFHIDFNKLYPYPNEILDETPIIVSPKYEWNTELVEKIQEIDNKVSQETFETLSINNIPSEEGILKSEPSQSIEVTIATANGSNQVIIFINNNEDARRYLPKGANFMANGIKYTLVDNIESEQPTAFTTTVDMIEGMDISTSLNRYLTTLNIPTSSWDTILSKHLGLEVFLNSGGAIRATNALGSEIIDLIWKFRNLRDQVSNIEDQMVVTTNTEYNPSATTLKPNTKYIITEENFIFNNLINFQHNPMTPSQYIYISFNTLNSYPKFYSGFFGILSGWAGEEPTLGQDGYYTFEDGYHYEICINNEGYAICAKFNPTPGTSVANEEGSE